MGWAAVDFILGGWWWVRKVNSCTACNANLVERMVMGEKSKFMYALHCRYRGKDGWVVVGEKRNS